MPHLELDDGFRLYYERHGEGPPVILAHGAGGNAMSWWRQVPVFSERYSIITLDHRAFGRSPDVEGGPGRTAFGPDAAALVDALDLGPVHFVCAARVIQNQQRSRSLDLLSNLQQGRAVVVEGEGRIKSPDLPLDPGAGFFGTADMA